METDYLSGMKSGIASCGAAQDHARTVPEPRQQTPLTWPYTVAIVERKLVAVVTASPRLALAERFNKDGRLIRLDYVLPKRRT